jgi:hypothetical protein
VPCVAPVFSAVPAAKGEIFSIGLGAVGPPKGRRWRCLPSRWLANALPDRRASRAGGCDGIHPGWQFGTAKRGRFLKPENLPRLRALSLCFLLPGLAGLILSAVISTRYMNTLPRDPDPDNLRLVPRNINGYIVYQTEREDRFLDRMEYSSVGLFLIGLSTGLVYLQKWGLARAIEAEDDEFVPDQG